MLVLGAVMPTVMKPAIDSHTPCRAARTGSMPCTVSAMARITDATAIADAEKSAMKRAVSTTLGSTWSLRPSDS